MKYSVNHWSNMRLETTDVGAPGSFLQRWQGITGWQPTNATISTPYTWAKFRNYQAFPVSGSASNAPGGGDYRPNSDSPLHRYIQTGTLWQDEIWYMPYDNDGRPRGRWDPPGAFITGNKRKGFVE